MTPNVLQLQIRAQMQLPEFISLGLEIQGAITSVAPYVDLFHKLFTKLEINYLISCLLAP